jgi:hypothetical protein
VQGVFIDQRFDAENVTQQRGGEDFLGVPLATMRP